MLNVMVIIILVATLLIVKNFDNKQQNSGYFLLVQNSTDVRCFMRGGIRTLTTVCATDSGNIDFTWGFVQGTLGPNMVPTV